MFSWSPVSLAPSYTVAYIGERSPAKVALLDLGQSPDVGS